MSSPTWLDRYIARGFRLVFYPTKTKGPKEVGWTSKVYTAADYVEGLNVGTMTGHEIAPGRFLADVDFDWPEGLQFARKLLPSTSFGFGRESRKITHAMWTTPEPLVTKVYEDISGENLVELRGTKIDGSLGMQTMLPPSIHPNGETLALRVDEEITLAPHLEKQVTHYAIACLLFKHLGARGLLHDTRLALAGFLLGIGIIEEEATLIAEAVAEAAGNNVEDAATAVRSTAARIKNGERVNAKGALARAIGNDGKKVVARISDWLGGNEFIVDPTNDRISANSQENIRRALKKLDVKLNYDEFKHKPLITRGEGPAQAITDPLMNRIWFEIDETFHFRPTKEFFQDLMLDLAHQNKFHPVRDYLDGLTWDGVSRIDTWLSAYGRAADNVYTRAVGRLVLVAAVRRVRSPGCKFDEMLVLESEQGTLKSSALAALCPLDEWFSDSLTLTDDAKQVIEATAGKWVIEVAELSGMGRAGVEHLKAMCSRQHDGPVRLAYARLSTEVARQFIIIGTTNSHAYLLDVTGNRRFWPVRVEMFDVAGLRRDREQLWAEAAHYESQGESIRLAPSLYGVAALQQERRRLDDAWEPIIQNLFDPTDAVRITYDKIWDALNIPVAHRDDRGQRRIIQIMQRLGFRQVTMRDKGKIIKGWGREAIRVTEHQPTLPHSKDGEDVH